MQKFHLLLLGLIITQTSFAQSYDSWIIGDTSDVSTNPTAGTILAGGGGDNDDAMTWMLNRADGGDILVIRASGSDGYNDYLYTDLGVSVNSVETIRFNDTSAAYDQYVERRILEAEALFIAGGNQHDYYEYWRDTPIEDAINHLINTKGVVVGGTSAGMAIMGHVYYVPPGAGVISSEALSDPYHTEMNIIGRDDFVDNDLLENTITDTHFDDRSRAGRLTAFMARMETDWGINAKGIACNEYTAVCIDTNGWAHVYGDWPNYPDYAYFVQSVCDVPASLPENCTSGQALDWDQDQNALKVYKVPGTITGSNYFDLTDWDKGQGGDWNTWYVDNGSLNQLTTAPSQCDSLGVYNEELVSPEVVFEVYPNPATNQVIIGFGLDYNSPPQLEITDGLGRVIWQKKEVYDFPATIETNAFPAGIYFIKMYQNHQIFTQKLIIQQK